MSYQSLIRISGIISLTILLGGCATSGRKLDQQSMDAIQKGMSRADVETLVGSPDQISRNSEGEVTYNYSYSRAVVKGESFIPIIGSFAGGVDTQTQSLTVCFGPDGLVKGVTSTYGSSDVSQDLSAGGKASMPGIEQNKRPKS